MEDDATDGNPRGITRAPFIDKVEEYVAAGEGVAPTLQRLDDILAKYKIMESNRIQNLQRLQNSIPDLQKTLTAVKFLESKTETEEEIETRFELNDTLYATASIQATKEVYLWLGANVMVAFPIEEAKTLLTEKIAAQQENMQICQEDLAFLREQITTMEVNIARTFNWDVKRQREAKTTTVEDAPKNGTA